VHPTRSDLPHVLTTTQPASTSAPATTARRAAAWKSSVKRFGSIYADTDIASWLREHNVDTVTVVGYMTNNCVIASAVEGEGLEFTTEVLSDATGAIHLANEAGSVDAKTVHTTMMTLLNSNFAAVGTTAAWSAALSETQKLDRSDLGSSAVAGAQAATGA